MKLCFTPAHNQIDSRYCMPKIEVGKRAPAFTLPAINATIGESKIRLTAYKNRAEGPQGQNVVVYFYPRDATPGCTTESQDFRDAKGKFKKLNTIILGISQDSIASHEKFIGKHSLNFDLLSDESGDICRKYGVLKMKNMYGKKFEGIERSTFLIDTNGVLRAEWRKVKVPGHVNEVLAVAKKVHTET